MLVLTKKNEAWVEYENEKVRCKFKLRALDRRAIQELRKKAIKKKYIATPAGRQVVEDVDDELFDSLVFDYIIVDWEDIIDDEGKKLPCTKENKLMVVNSVPNLSNWLLDEAMALFETLSRQKEEELKNLKNSQAGSSKENFHASNARS